MRLVHFADCHLGAYRYTKMVKDTGQNLRQHDVQVAFCRMMGEVIALQPDIVVVGGDLFEESRPNNRTIEVAMQEFGRLLKALPSCCVVVVAGNHDTPRADENGHVFRILGTLPLHVIDGGIQRVDHHGVSILCVPDTPAAQREIKEMKTRGLTIGQLVNEKADKNVLLMHGEVEGMLPRAAHLPSTAHRSEVERPLEELAPDAWNYVALGHWHVYREMAPRTFYSGSLEYTSTDPWSEMRQEAALGLAGKGFVEHDLETGAHTFHPLTTERRHIELPTFSADGMTSKEVDAAIAERIGAVDIDGQVVRLRIDDCPRALAHDLDQTAIRKYKLRALNFDLDPRKPEPVTHVSTVSSTGKRHNGAAIALRIAQKIVDRVMPADVNHTDLLNAASIVLEQVKMDGDPTVDLVKLLEASIAQAKEANEAKAA